jgi:hypothetical protein
MTSVLLTNLIVVWVVLLLALVAFAVREPRTGGALVLSYFFGLSLIHLPGAIIYLDPLSPAPSRTETEIGFTLTIIGMVAFAAGAILTRASHVQEPTAPVADVVPALSSHIWPLFIIGMFSYFVLMPRANAIPSGTALVSALGALLIIGLWLRFYTASLTGRVGRVLTTLLVLPLLPLATLTMAGFLGYGVYWVLSCITFLFVITQRRMWFYLATPFAGALGLSLFAVYFSVRTAIRLVVGIAGSSFYERFLAIWEIVNKFEVLDLNSPLLIFAIDQRLNQNYLVGYAAERYQAGAVQLGYGSTVQLWAVIPRALWPDKPDVGGGGDVVSHFTGLPFAEGTSVGVGQVMEFYMNFGMPGLIAGFFILGVVLMRIDLGMMRALRNADMRNLLLYALPGLTLMQPGGNLQEVIIAVIGAIVASRMVIAFGLFGTGSNPILPKTVPEIAE